MSYNGRSGHGYGNNKWRGFKSLMGVQNTRSQRSIMMDNRLRAPLAKSEEQWTPMLKWSKLDKY